MSQLTRSPRTSLAAAAALALAILAIVGIHVFLAARAGPAALEAPISYSLQVDQPRVCAAVAAYAGATEDQWDQRAALAQASLNRFRQLGHVPDCGGALGAILTEGLDQHLWQASLDAVDAVQAGSYVLPDACMRADTVAATPAGQSTPARAQCVIGSLAFFESATAASRTVALESAR